VVHSIVIPLYGNYPSSLVQQLHSFIDSGFSIILIDNGSQVKDLPCTWMISNNNAGGLAGALNRGIEFACSHGVQWITLIDQDSIISPFEVALLREGLQHASATSGSSNVVVGPIINDITRPKRLSVSILKDSLLPARLLITSGTTFCSAQWPSMELFNEWLFIDYIDHDWCLRLRAKGYKFFQISNVILTQTFGQYHPSALCHFLGMQLYSPQRHYYMIRNLLWLMRQLHFPLDIRVKEILKTSIKLPLWLLVEPYRLENLTQLARAIRSPIPPIQDPVIW